MTTSRADATERISPLPETSGQMILRPTLILLLWLR